MLKIIEEKEPQELIFGAVPVSCCFIWTSSQNLRNVWLKINDHEAIRIAEGSPVKIYNFSYRERIQKILGFPKCGNGPIDFELSDELKTKTLPERFEELSVSDCVVKHSELLCVREIKSSQVIVENIDTGINYAVDKEEKFDRYLGQLKIEIDGVEK